MSAFYGGIEAGGAKFICAVGTSPGDLCAETQFPITTLIETIGRAISFFREQQEQETLAAIGIGSFGSVDTNVARECAETTQWLCAHTTD